MSNKVRTETFETVRKTMKRLKKSLNKGDRAELWKILMQGNILNVVEHHCSRKLTDFDDVEAYALLRGLSYSVYTNDVPPLMKPRYVKGDSFRAQFSAPEHKMRRLRAVRYAKWFDSKCIKPLYNVLILHPALLKWCELAAQPENYKMLEVFVSFPLEEGWAAEEIGRYTMQNSIARSIYNFIIEGCQLGARNPRDRVTVLAGSGLEDSSFADRNRMPAAYHFAYDAQVTGKLTEDFGGIFRCTLAKRTRSGDLLTYEGYGVRYVEDGETSWGFARTVNAAAQLARKKLAENLQDVCKSSQGVSFSTGGFL